MTSQAYSAPATRPGPPPGLFVVIPAYNESRAIGPVIDSLLDGGYTNIVVVDDGSADDTALVARTAGAIVLRHAINLGQGAALQTAIDYGLLQGAQYICTFDADGQHEVQSISALYNAVAASQADIALGSRFLGLASNMPVAKQLLLRLAVAFTRLHSGISVTDTHNGMRLLTRRAAEKIRISHPGMAHASELLQQIRARGLRYVEVPITVRYTAYSLSKGQSLFNSVKILFELLYAWISK